MEVFDCSFLIDGQTTPMRKAMDALLAEEMFLNEKYKGVIILVYPVLPGSNNNGSS
ncbi:MAG: hypothetical protein SNJ78_10800 [Spirochaetales bacterium]